MNSALGNPEFFLVAQRTELLRTTGDLDALQTWKLKPATLKGALVAAAVTVEMMFRFKYGFSPSYLRTSPCPDTAPATRETPA